VAIWTQLVDELALIDLKAAVEAGSDVFSKIRKIRAGWVLEQPPVAETTQGQDPDREAVRSSAAIKKFMGRFQPPGFN
jgi:hypothetical protein